MSSLPSSEPSEHTPATPQELERINQQIQANQFVPALTALTQLVVRDMRNATLWLYIGLAYTRMGNWKPAISALETALELNPQEVQARHLLALALFSTGRQQEACELIDRVAKQSNLGPQWMMRAYLHAHTSRDPMHALKVARDWGKRFADPLTRQAKPLKVSDRRPGKKLKVGYVTADFREHSVAFFMQPVLAHHNPDDVEVHVYSNGPADNVTVQMRSLVPHWRDVQGVSDEHMLQQIRAEGIDVLVDLSGYTHGHRLGVFARRAAPVQVTWLGYMQTLGMKAMDYRLVDGDLVPLGHDSYYSEKLFRLSCMASYAPPAYAPLCEQPPMQRNGYPTLISLNSSAKITDEMLRIWARILYAREDARLIIMVKEENADAAQSHMQPRVESAGLPLERVSVLHQQPLKQFMELGHIADVALDTSPISGGTTTLHALWMGLPVVALDAERAVDSSSARILQGLGWRHWATQSEQEYIDLALAFMGNLRGLERMRAESRDRLKNSSLMKYSERTEELEKAYRFMWLNYLRGDSRDLDVNVDFDQVLIEVNNIP